MMDLDWGDDEVTPKGRPTLAIPPNWMADPEICAMAAYAYYRIWKPNGKKHWRCMEEYFAQTFGFAIRADHFKRAGLVRSISIPSISIAIGVLWPSLFLFLCTQDPTYRNAA